MKFFSRFLIVFSIAAFSAACSSSETVADQTNSANAAANTNSGGRSETVNVAAPNEVVNAGPSVVIPGMNAPADGSEPPAASNQHNVAGVDAPVKPTAKPAPDDSEFTAILTDVGLETRTFRSHPQLDKVERITSPKKSVIKVYMKTGKVVEIPSEKIKDLRSAPVSLILTAAGIEPPPPVDAGRVNPGKKKEADLK